jgi:hypothetical protein
MYKGIHVFAQEPTTPTTMEFNLKYYYHHLLISPQNLYLLNILIHLLYQLRKLQNFTYNCKFVTSHYRLFHPQIFKLYKYLNQHAQKRT